MKLLQKYKVLFFFLGFAVLVMPEIIKVYLIMPFPGSQHTDHVALAYVINKYIWLSRIVGGFLLLGSLLAIYNTAKLWQKITATLMIVVAAVVTYLTTFVMKADHMFYQPHHTVMAKASDADKDMLVIGVTIGGDAHAYPVEIIGYHHQVLDTVGGTAVMVTYCTVCRTGMVYKPMVGDKPEKFRLVGMDQFNAMFEDATTQSWWRQATGECCAGPLKGQKLTEILSQQMTLQAWLMQHPTSKVMQPDPDFVKEYAGLKGYGDGSKGGALTGTDTVSFHPKSWTILVSAGTAEKAYDWRTLSHKGAINDKIGAEPVVLVMDSDRQSFYCFSRGAGEKELIFAYDRTKNMLTDTATATMWDMSGKCVEGSMTGSQLMRVPAYQEFYHSVHTFHSAAPDYKE